MTVLDDADILYTITRQSDDVSYDYDTSTPQPLRAVLRLLSSSVKNMDGSFHRWSCAQMFASNEAFRGQAHWPHKILFNFDIRAFQALR